MVLNMRDDIGIWRSIKVGKLRDALAKLPDDANVVVGQIGNLQILEGKVGQEDDWVCTGWIDLTAEEYQEFSGFADDGTDEDAP